MHSRADEGIPWLPCEGDVSMIARSGQNAGFMQSAFQRELAEFVGFIGGADVDKVIRKVEQKLRPLPADTRSLFGDRFFFHEQFTAFTCGPLPFQLDTTDLRRTRRIAHRWGQSGEAVIVVLRRPAPPRHAARQSAT
jgi:hypothetical protein